MAVRLAPLPHRKEAGFTLIELMVVAAIIAILAVVGGGGSSELIASSQRKEAREQMRTAFQKARALSVSNSGELREDVASALVCIGTDAVIRVFSVDPTALINLPDACNDSGPQPRWQAHIAGASATQLIDPSTTPATEWKCLALNHRGRAIAYTLGGSACTLPPVIRVVLKGKSIDFSWL